MSALSIHDRFALWRRDRRRTKRHAMAERAFFSALLDLGPGDIAVDCGANVGFYARHMARSGATVHAFEPDPEAFAELSRLGGDAPNLTLHNAAVGPEAGRATLARAPGFEADPLARSVASSLLAPAGAGAVEVDVIDFRSFLRSLPKPPALMKLDIEGAEVALLEALEREKLLAGVREIFVETHERQHPELRARTLALVRRLGRESGGPVDFDWG